MSGSFGSTELDGLSFEAELAFRKGDTARAELFCRRLLRAHPTDAGTLHLLGLVHAARGDDAESLRLFVQSLAYFPENFEARCDLATACHKCGLSSEAIRHFKDVISTYPDCYRAYSQLATLYYQVGRLRDAAGLYRDWLSRDPTNVEVQHMILAAESGDNPPPCCSEDFVRTHFDNCADVFDERLIEHLGYRGHEIAATAYTRYTDTLGGELLDAGCGTGLCGIQVRPYCGRLVGVDLSEKMLDFARTRGIYDELVVSELCAFMTSMPNLFAGIIAADVLIYFGDLECVMKSAYCALRLQGILVVTLEYLPDSVSLPYRLGVHGRYSHCEAYVRGVVSRSGFELLHIGQERIRFELEKEVIGFVVVARKA